MEVGASRGSVSIPRRNGAEVIARPLAVGVSSQFAALKVSSLVREQIPLALFLFREGLSESELERFGVTLLFERWN